MAKQPRVWSGSQWEPLAVTLPDLSNYYTKSEVDSNFSPSSWTSYTPTFRTGTDVKTATINYAKYIKLGKTLFVQVRLSPTAAGTASARINISLPAGFTYQNQSTAATHGTFVIQDTGTAYYTGIAQIDGDVVYGLGYNSVNNMGTSAPTMTIASGDFVSFNINVEVA